MLFPCYKYTKAQRNIKEILCAPFCLSAFVAVKHLHFIFINHYYHEFKKQIIKI